MKFHLSTNDNMGVNYELLVRILRIIKRKKAKCIFIGEITQK